MALSTGSGGGGGFGIRKIPGGVEVFYLNKGSYDYFEVIQKGRARYSIKQALLRSPRAKQGPNGKYIVVPITRNEGGSKVSPKNNPINAILRSTGQESDDSGQPRKKYKHVGSMGGGGNVYGMQQGPVKGGGMQYSYMKFVLVSQKTEGFWYPAIKGEPIEEKVQKQVNQALESESLKKAVRLDIESFINQVTK